MNVGDIVTSNARLFPDKTAIIDTNARLTWRQFNDRVNQLAQAMLALGLKKGDRAAIIAENGHEFAEFFFAIAKTGLITVCLNHRLTTAQLIHILSECQPRIIFAQNKFVPVAAAIGSEVKSIESMVGIGKNHGCRHDYESLLSEQTAGEPNIEVSEQDIFRLQYTTGTTGTRKGVMLTHKNEITNCMMRLQAVPTFRNDILLEYLPLFATGTQARFFGTCFLGVTIVFITYSPKTVAETIEKEKITYIPLLPTLFRGIRQFIEENKNKYDLSSLRKIQAAGGQPCSATELREMLDYFSVPYTNSCKSYGLTESSSPGTYLVPEDVAAGLSPGATEKQKRRLDSLGKPLMNCQVRIVDDNDNDVPPGQIGELVLKGDQVMKGYWNNPELTARTLRGGWLHTADLATADDDGYVYFKGRKDFVIKSGGFLVGPDEVESVIFKHPAVADVAVIGVSDEKWGQAVTAVVCVKPGQHVTEAEIKEHCRKYLADYQLPKSTIFTEKLPRESGYDKVDRRTLIKTYGNRP